MSTDTFPKLTISPFVGVDWQTDPDRLPIGGLQDINGMRITRDGRVKPCEGWSAGVELSGGTGVLSLVHYTGQNVILALSASGGTVYLDECPLGMASKTAKGNFAIATGSQLASMVEMHEMVFISCYRQNLRYWNDSSIVAMGSADTDLDSDSDENDPLKFAGISKFQGHLIGWGYGDQTGAGSSQTNDLGENRPEIVRWSNLGQPLKWRPDNWIMVGTRGVPILAGPEVFGRCAIMKPEGIWLLYGDLEQNYPQLEALQTDSGRAMGVVGPQAWEVYDGVLYWMGPGGPFRWVGGQAAEWIGWAVPVMRQWARSHFVVVGVPEFDAVAFIASNKNLGPTIPGMVAPSGDGSFAVVWLWDCTRETWVSQFDVTTSSAIMAALVAPAANGQHTTYFGPGRTFSDAVQQPDNNVCKFETGVFPLNEGRWAVVRGIVVEGSFASVDADNHITVTLTPDAGTEPQTLDCFITTSASDPASPAEGDYWYDRTNYAMKRYDGSAWVQLFGVPNDTIRLPCNFRARSMKIKVQLPTDWDAADIAIRSLDVQIRPL